MKSNAKTTRVNLDGVHSLDITVNEQAKIVVAELVTGNESTFIYAEKFDAPCNYLRTAIKKAIMYLSGDIPKSEVGIKNSRESNIYT